MGLEDSIKAGQISELEQIERVGKNAIESAETERKTLLQQKKDELSQIENYIKIVSNAINELKTKKLSKAQDNYHAAYLALQTAKAQLDSCKGTANERAAAAAVANCETAVEKWKECCKKIFKKMDEFNKKKEDLERNYNDILAEIAKIEGEGGQLTIGARDKFKEDRVQAAINLQKSYPGGR